MNSWNSIFEQDAAVTRLRQAYRADRLPHGMIFSGPLGVGKATVAAVLGALFLCDDPQTDEPCGRCDSCRGMDAGNHPDFHVVTKELVRYYDKTGKSKAIEFTFPVIKGEVVEKANRKSVMNRGKVFVIEQADLMNLSAQNSLLKTLEEPAGRTLVILLTDTINGLLPTIRSRCQTIHFGQMSERLVEEKLRARKVDPATARRAAVLSGGSLGVAIRWIDDGIVTFVEDLLTMLDQIAAGDPADRVPDWFKSAAESYAEKQLERDPLGSKDQATREGLSLYLKVAADHIRATLRIEEDAEKLERACGTIDAITRAEGYLDSNVNVALTFQQLAGALETASR